MNSNTLNVILRKIYPALSLHHEVKSYDKIKPEIKTKLLIQKKLYVIVFTFFYPTCFFFQTLLLKIQYNQQKILIKLFWKLFSSVNVSTNQIYCAYNFNTKTKKQQKNYFVFISILQKQEPAHKNYILPKIKLPRIAD